MASAAKTAPARPRAPAEAPPPVRGYWRDVAARFLRNRTATVALVFLLLILATVFVGAPLAAHLIGHGPNDLNPHAGGDPLSGVPSATFWTWVPGDPIYMPHRSLYVLGADGPTGRDVFLRILYGGRITLEIAVMATVAGVLFGAVLGTLAGYFGGWVGGVVTWLTDLMMVFPFLLFGIALWTTIGPDLMHVTLGIFPHGVLLLTAIIAAFSWFYPMRIARMTMLSLREREFVEAARMVGASDWRIVRTHLLPQLLGPLLTYAAIVMAAAMVAEAGLSWLGLRIPIPGASWGGMLADAANVLRRPEVVWNRYMAIIPAIGVLGTAIALNLISDGLRGALDPRAVSRR